MDESSKRDDPKRIRELKDLDKIISDLRKKNKKLSSLKMVQMSKDISEESLFRHIEIIKLLAGEGYKMTTENLEIITGMIYYFLGLQEKSAKYGFDLAKGIGITGAWGVGKTTLFGVFHDYLEQMCNFDYNPNTFRITSLDEIILDVQNKTKNEAAKSKFLYNVDPETGLAHPIHICINEFGVRFDMKDYGSDVNELFDAFMMIRYDIFIKYGKVTHVTTNYGAKDLEKIFDAKLIDRFREMWNFKNLKGESFRK